MEKGEGLYSTIFSCFTDHLSLMWTTQLLSWDYPEIMAFCSITGKAYSFHNIKWIQKGNVHSVVANSVKITFP